MFKCPNCGNPIAVNAAFCPSCGQQKPFDALTGALGCMGIMFVLLFFAPAILFKLLFISKDLHEALEDVPRQPGCWIGSIAFWTLFVVGFIKLKRKGEQIESESSSQRPDPVRRNRNRIMKRPPAQQRPEADIPDSGTANVQPVARTPQQGSLKMGLLKTKSESGFEALQATFSGVLNAKDAFLFQSYINDLVQKCDVSGQYSLILDVTRLTIPSEAEQKAFVKGTDLFIKSNVDGMLAFVAQDPQSFASILKRYSTLTVFPFHEMCHPDAAEAMRFMQSGFGSSAASDTEGQIRSFEYSAMSPNGQEVNGEITATTQDEAVDKIKAKNLFPFKVTPKQHPLDQYLLGGK